MTWLLPALVVVAITGALWAASLGLEWLLAYRRDRRPTHVSDASLRAFAREEMRAGWDRQLPWPKQRKGAAGFWDRKPAKLRDVSRRAS